MTKLCSPEILLVIYSQQSDILKKYRIYEKNIISICTNNERNNICTNNKK
jgi:hypothetical protein